MLLASKTYAQSDTAHYLVMKVNDAILDCPHFMGLFKQMEKRNNWKEVERNFKSRYLVYSYPSNIDGEIIEKFKKELNDMHFPMGVVSDIYTKNNMEEVKKSVGN